ncbi:hypothetical protein YPPY56_3147, partial [Yersinia pestis PY-56]
MRHFKGRKGGISQS